MSLDNQQTRVYTNRKKFGPLNRVSTGQSSTQPNRLHKQLGNMSRLVVSMALQVNNTYKQVEIMSRQLDIMSTDIS